MTGPSLRDTMRDAVAGLGRARRRATAQRRLGAARPIEQLLVVPPSLRTADPSFPAEFEAGQFGIGGVTVSLGLGSPFEVRPPDPDWARELYGFAWLRHFDAGRSLETAAMAQALVLAWLDRAKSPPALAVEPAVRARRVLSWLAHAGVLCDGADRATYDRIMGALSRDVAALDADRAGVADGIARVAVHLALVQAYLAFPDSDARRVAAERGLTTELDAQIHGDGGHVSRHPGILLEPVLDLIALRQCYVMRRLVPPTAVSRAIERILPMLRHRRLGDGTIARFNGMGPTELDTLATVLGYDRGYPDLPAFAPDSRYVRLAHGAALVSMDAGLPPPAAHADHAHAGCLSFEWSVGRHAVVVNAGAPAPGQSEPHRTPPRATAGHSTLVLSETSSAVLVDGAVHLDGPVTVVVDDTGPQPRVEASHDGYAARYGLRHTRRLALGAGLEGLEGLDRLSRTGAGLPDAKVPFAVHFHLAAGIDVRMGPVTGTVSLRLPDGQAWTFETTGETTGEATGASVGVEDSRFHASHKGSLETLQIVLRGAAGDGVEIGWRFRRA